ncbi:hypothetical protein ACGF3C_25330, partial [Micromonospora sp. NPDC047762]|uniref:hypothetical protein n=1 Tax=Micromonospora sp. NPDC047762 TaxID=3364255 RepID=UPI00371A6CF9
HHRHQHKTETRHKENEHFEYPKATPHRLKIKLRRVSEVVVADEDPGVAVIADPARPYLRHP